MRYPVSQLCVYERELHLLIAGHFIEVPSGQLFVAQFGGSQADKTVLLLPSVFEEMNLSRAIVAKQAQMLVDNGYCVYCLDYLGTGDSSGETEDVNAQVWQHNILDVLKWIQSQGATHIHLWGVRLGALLMMNQLQAIHELLPIKQVLLWKPVAKGKQFMTQFLRLKQANSMMAGDEKGNWREHIMQGNPTEVAGYVVTAELLSSLDELNLPSSLPDSLSSDVRISWFELAAKSITPAVTMAVKEWPESQLSVRAFEGSAFWQIPEIFEQPFLHQDSLRALAGEDTSC